MMVPAKVGGVLPGALLTGFIVKRTLEETRAVLEHRLEDTARVDAAALDREFNGTIRVLQALAQSPHWTPAISLDVPVRASIVASVSAR